MMEKQHELLRLIMAEMKIVAESDQYDEGVAAIDTDICGGRERRKGGEAFVKAQHDYF